MKLIHDQWAVDCATLGRNVVNPALKPKLQIWTQIFELLKKVGLNKNRYHEKSNHFYQNERCLIMARVNAKTIHTVIHVYLTTMTVQLRWHTYRFILVFPTRVFPNPKPVFFAIFYYPKPGFFSTTKPGYFKQPRIAVAFQC